MLIKTGGLLASKRWGQEGCSTLHRAQDVPPPWSPPVSGILCGPTLSRRSQRLLTSLTQDHTWRQAREALRVIKYLARPSDTQVTLLSAGLSLPGKGGKGVYGSLRKRKHQRNTLLLSLSTAIRAVGSHALVNPPGPQPMGKAAKGYCPFGSTHFSGCTLPSHLTPGP